MTSVSSSTSSASSIANSATVTTTGTSNSTSINWDTLIEASVASKTARADSIETKITANEAKVSAYQELQGLLDTLATNTETLASSVINSLSGSAFAARAATISTTGDVSASSVLSMSIDDGAVTGDHTLTITQVATAHKVLGTSVADKTEALGYSGVFSIGVEGGDSVDISVTDGMSLADIASAINAQSSTTNVQASVIQVSSTSYELLLSASVDNATIETSSVSGTDIMTALGITDDSGEFTNEVQQPQPAIITLDGITISRDTNDIDDVLDGVTFNLLQATPSGSSISFDIEPDADTIVAAVEQFVTDYNAVREFIIGQQATSSDGTASDDAVLFGDSTLRDLMTQISAALNTTVGGLSLADLGLTFDSNNELSLDSSTLTSTLSSDLDGVIALLSTQLTPSSSSLSVVNTNVSPPSSFTLDIEVDSSGALSSVSVNGDSSLFTISGKSIIGAAGTDYAGIAFTFRGTSSESITVTASTGIAAMLTSIAENASDTTSGSLQTLISDLQTQNATLQERADTINSAAATFEENLRLRYAKYQAAIESANSTLDYLKALLNADSD
ncbi:flagellar hook-associated protein 2 [Rhodopseudomonas thermotolerans]|uniref:Flagellar hook-associated protein 2 n=2 Tax=Rhodopseudomonas TaxID=1073 RepID=A0A336JVE4_9BRAD|nr:MULTISPECIES: flagellar filament capping protein FliD [Rhodopseudomonas]RED28087.1 flagellar hook-associated protein 2 [Rhodopseudomonas pentothenatexigens]REF91341.1 flagellar hook-associated protein 2 [Rhodopseudomonas thermotolerans]SSW92673.1 flagellar hook-associated protein 2 [Rhodopseudomonas pentothenatexigens]